MPGSVHETAAMLAGLDPVVQPGRWIFCVLSTGSLLPPEALASFVEEEGLSAILPLHAAERIGADTALPMTQITLTVDSSLIGVGLTAAVATALAEKAIPCNMVAAFHHDHVFVPETLAPQAMETLRALQSLHRG
jgi:uncharacterized protein